MSDLAKRIYEVDRLVHNAAAAVEVDGGASAALKSAVEAFQRASKQAEADLDHKDDAEIREQVNALADAADKAEAAAGADEGIDDQTRKVLTDAYLAAARLRESV